MEKGKWVLIGIVSLALVVFAFGCASLSEYTTPSRLDKRAIAYAEDAGVIDANDFKGWQNLEKQIRLHAAVDAAFQVNDLALRQMLDKNQLDHSQLADSVSTSLEAARQREQNIFGEKGILPLVAGFFGFGGLGAAIGKFAMKRPGDMTPADLQNIVEPIKGELGIKDQQFAQVVTGVERFMKHKDEITSLMSKDMDAEKRTDAILDLMKTYLGRTQDASTQQEVAKVRATV